MPPSPSLNQISQLFVKWHFLKFVLFAERNDIASTTKNVHQISITTFILILALKYFINSGGFNAVTAILTVAV